MKTGNGNSKIIECIFFLKIDFCYMKVLIYIFVTLYKCWKYPFPLYCLCISCCAIYVLVVLKRDWTKMWKLWLQKIFVVYKTRLTIHTESKMRLYEFHSKFGCSFITLTRMKIFYKYSRQIETPVCAVWCHHNACSSAV